MSNFCPRRPHAVRVLAPIALCLVSLSLAAGCSRSEPRAKRADAAPVTPEVAPPEEIDAGQEPPAASAEPPPPAPCPQEMVLIPADKPYCIDRWEAMLVDKKSGERLSPYYPPSRTLAPKLRDRWERKRWEAGSVEARSMPLPPLPAHQIERDPIPMAVSRPDETPNGYLSGKVAQAACENAGKRLCTRDEWVRACRGRADQPFPYGDTYKPMVCNIVRSTHPSGALHDDVTTGHLDPRLNLVKDKQGPLLRTTGATKTCASVWGDDALYDMVGNLDEWVDDPDGTFVGGFFARGKKDGCLSVVKNHPILYFDYSLGVRCCMFPAD